MSCASTEPVQRIVMSNSLSYAAAVSLDSWVEKTGQVAEQGQPEPAFPLYLTSPETIRQWRAAPEDVWQE